MWLQKVPTVNLHFGLTTSYLMRCKFTTQMSVMVLVWASDELESLRVHNGITSDTVL